jgi:hypothetical protein
LRSRGRKFVGAAVIALVSMIWGAPFAGADVQTLSDDFEFSTTAATGTRTLTAAVAPTFPATQDLALDQSVDSVTPGTSVVTELLSSGSAWAVTARVCGPDSYATPTAPDCTGAGDQVTGNASQVIDGSEINATHSAPTAVDASALLSGTFGGTTTAGANSNMDSAITLMSNTGQNANNTYNGLYSSATSLSIPNFQKIGTWKGYWVATLTY